MTKTKPKVNLGVLSGRDGNVYVIMGRCSEAARRAGWTPAETEAAMARMKSGDYEHLLRVVQELFDARFIR